MIYPRTAIRSRSRLSLLPALAVALIAAAVPQFAAATTFTWTGTSSHLWSNSSNWTTGTSIGVPTTGDDVVLTNAGLAPTLYDLGSTHAGVNPQFHTVTLGANSAGYFINPASAGVDKLTLQSGGSLSDTNNDAAAPADAITTGIAIN